MRKIGQHASQSVYKWVPVQTWDRVWTDDQLYKRYGLDGDEIAYIEAMIKPMNLGAVEPDE